MSLGLIKWALMCAKGVGVLRESLNMKRIIIKVINPSLTLTIQILHLQGTLFLISSSSPRETQILQA